MVGSLLSTGVAGATIPLQNGGGGGGLLAVFGLLFFIVPLLIALVTIAGMWKVFTKAGQPGWAAIIPIYNVYILVSEIAGRDTLWVVLCILFSPILIVPLIDVAKAFGKGAGYGVGLFLLSFIFFPLLGFGDARYQGAPN
jgi:hypothetical protein